MFVKVTRSKNFKYLQLVESYRQGQQTKHRVIANLGRLDKLIQNDQLVRIARRLLEVSGHEVAGILPEDIEEVKRLRYGHVVYQKIWDKLKLTETLNEAARSTHRQYNFADQVFYLVINRLLNPSSKKKAFESQEEFYGLKAPEHLQHLYRSLDVLCTHKEKIEQGLFETQRRLFGLKVDVVFYDVTTFHFESVSADGLKDFGFSKAGKFNEVQVVMGLLINEEGLPVGYELFCGNTFEGKTLVSALKKLKERFSIKRVIIVADKGMNSKSNLHLIRQAGFDYIIAFRLRGAGKKIQQKAMNMFSHTVHIDKSTGEQLYSYICLNNKVRYKEKDENQKVLATHEWEDYVLVTWSKKRAAKDEKKRGRLLAMAEKLIAQKKVNVVKKNGANRYLLPNTKATACAIDWEKVSKDAKWDGYYAIQYSQKDLSHEQIMRQYHQLWKIEESFRVLKSTMKTRPIFHWTEKRIKGHFMLCFLAFVLERRLEQRLRNNQIHASPEAIKEALNSLQLSVLKIGKNGREYLLKGKNSPLAGKILRLLKITPRKNIEPI